jgi:hypothetical protein
VTGRSRVIVRRRVALHAVRRPAVPKNAVRPHEARRAVLLRVALRERRRGPVRRRDGARRPPAG